MSYDLRFQILALPNKSWGEYRDQYVRAEALGFDLGAVPAVYLAEGVEAEGDAAGEPGLLGSG
jgi:hypothetical protein